MAAHAEDALRCSGISQVLYLPLAVAAAEASRAEGLVPRQDGQIFDLIAASTTAVCAIVADEGAIAKEEEVRVRVEQGVAGIASEAVEMPSVSGWNVR